MLYFILRHGSENLRLQAGKPTFSPYNTALDVQRALGWEPGGTPIAANVL
jgi:hypothetical protein